MGSILLITVDTLRPDHLGIYGYARDTSPEIDRFFADVSEQSEMVRRIRDYPYTRQYADTLPYLYQMRQLATIDSPGW